MTDDEATTQSGTRTCDTGQQDHRVEPQTLGDATSADHRNGLWSRGRAFLVAASAAAISALLSAGLCTYLLPPTSEEMAWAEFGQARYYQDNQQYEMAHAAYGSAIQFQPGWAHLYRQKAWCYLDQREYQEASHAFSLALESDPENSGTLIDYAFALSKMREYQMALDPLDLVIQSDPTNLRALSLRADAYLHLGDTDRSKADRLAIRSLVFDEEPREHAAKHETTSKATFNDHSIDSE